MISLLWYYFRLSEYDENLILSVFLTQSQTIKSDASYTFMLSPQLIKSELQSQSQLVKSELQSELLI